MIISDSIFAMLLVEPFFKTFTPHALCDATTHTEAIVALSAESKAKVDEMAGAALAAGGTEPRERNDRGFMYSRAFADRTATFGRFSGWIRPLSPVSPRKIRQDNPPRAKRGEGYLAMKRQ
jgi:hypothetical protein